MHKEELSSLEVTVKSQREDGNIIIHMCAKVWRLPNLGVQLRSDFCLSQIKYQLQTPPSQNDWIVTIDL